MLAIGVSGCDGGPGFGTNVQVGNGCGEVIAVRLNDASSPPEGKTSSESVQFSIGESRTLLVSASAESVFLWVAVPGASSWGNAIEFGVPDLPETTLPDGTRARRLAIEDEMCPTG
jgi:hypothetical protein